MTVDPAKLREWERLAKGATPGPLTLMRYDQGGGRLYWEEGKDRKLVADFYHEGDREFYTAALEAVPALLEVLVKERAARRFYERRDEGKRVLYHDLSAEEQETEEIEASRELGLTMSSACPRCRGKGTYDCGCKTGDHEPSKHRCDICNGTGQREA